MARMARVVVPRIPHHITQRGNRRLITSHKEVIVDSKSFSWIQIISAIKNYSQSFV